MGWYERVALYLWRDRGGYQVGRGDMSDDYNVSLRTRFRRWRRARRGSVIQALPWVVPTVVSSAVAVGTVFLTHHLDAGKSDQQVKPNAGELLLRCTKQGDGILRCVQAVEGQHQVVARPNGDRPDHHRAGPEQ